MAFSQSDRVVIGVDAHKKSHTLVAVDPAGRKLAEKTIGTSTEANHAAMQWVRSKFGGEIVWGVEDCRSMTARLERDLLGAGFHVVRVPPHLMSRSRASARERGKSDAIDALAVARAVLREPDLPVAFHDETSMELRLLVDRREDLVGQRTATISRLLERIHQLDPEQPVPRDWSILKRVEELRVWLACQDGLLSELAYDELLETVDLRIKIDSLEKRISERIAVVAPLLLDIRGCGNLTAARIVAEVVRVDRFRSEAAFARYVGLAPIPRTSGSGEVWMRPTKHGNRQLHTAIHRIAIIQLAKGGPGREFFARRIADGDTRPRALRALKRRLARVVYTQLRRQAQLTPDLGAPAVARDSPPARSSRPEQ